MLIRAYRASDLPEWIRMRRALWPEYPADQEAAEMDAEMWLGRPDAAVFVAESTAEGGLCGFAEVGERPYADGCESGPVAFLEAWYVDAELRGQGVGSELLSAAEVWARSRGLIELASDALLENIAAQRAHEAVGFEEVERSVKFCKRLSGA